jgi:hypothetical protein
MTGPNLDWNAIRPLNGSRHSGFEELCSQLAREEAPADARFERNGTPDAGVECYAVLADGTEWGWQAKYVDGLGAPQWDEIDSSVRTALEKHPRLVRYFICVPYDRPDARLEGKRSARERWDDHVKKWKARASDRAMLVEFVYWGSSDLLDRLARPENVGRVRFWFDAAGLDAGWFKAKLDAAVDTVGVRYTRELHVDLPIAGHFEAIGRTRHFFDSMKATARSIRENLRGFDNGPRRPRASRGEADEPSTAHRLFLDATRRVLFSLAGLQPTPIGPLPFSCIAAEIAGAQASAETWSRELLQQEAALHAERVQDRDRAASDRETNPFQERRYRLMRVTRELEATGEAFSQADHEASATLLLVTGDAGTGKSHLLCDVATKRLRDGLPTVLLLGQRFTSDEEPWRQVLHHLDLAHLSVEEFVGGLEAAAQAAGQRALVLIDALNEGTGRRIWPSHLAAFLAPLERSPWIAVVLTLRSSYEQAIVPEKVRERAVRVEHRGFSSHEYDAVRTYFPYYGIELPSAPLLVPEFRNPLFLKVLCVGLRAEGAHRMPRGFRGISATFEKFLDAVNRELAKNLDFNPKKPLVRKAVEKIASAMVDREVRWLSLDDVDQIVNDLLPGRDFEHSLYRGLVSEGILIEEASRNRDEPGEETAQMAYERFSDHLVAKCLLDKHFDPNDPNAAFAAGAPLGFLNDPTQHWRLVPSGLLEALCIQVPERTKHELVELAPEVRKHWSFAYCFFQSIVWRAPASVRKATGDILFDLGDLDEDSSGTLDALVAVATVTGHALNARFLNEWLRGLSMPDRDALWSIYLHHSWEAGGPVKQLVDWAWSIQPSDGLDGDAIDLSGVTLAWMLTSSNRHLRDRATKALVSLYTGRLNALTTLVERFADVDDPYVAERVYAVAYGVALRSHDAVEIGRLARCIYDRVFASSATPAHFLLRDYARGVMERALSLGTALDISPAQFRPPYRSTWPRIPTEAEVASLKDDWSRGSYDSGDIEWSRNMLASSVLDGDFARYVIGTNSHQTDWLSLRIDEAKWRPVEERIEEIVAGLSEDGRAAWELFKSADEVTEHALHLRAQRWTFARLFKTPQGPEAGNVEEEESEEDETDELEDLLSDLAKGPAPAGVAGAASPAGAEAEPATPPADDEDEEVERMRDEATAPEMIAALEERRAAALAAVCAKLDDATSAALMAVMRDVPEERRGKRPPRFDLKLIQRYVLWRVFDLGWTTERFGYFDRFLVRSHGRDASKPERLGKKYQWIAYHEILALVADHFQYRERARGADEDSERAYQGTWQDYWRDIDPSVTIAKLPAGATKEGSAPGWWAGARYQSWGSPAAYAEWVRCTEDLPMLRRPGDMLTLVRPEDGTRWVNLEGSFRWEQPTPPDQEVTDVARREIWYEITGYLLRSADVETFMAWAEGVDFSGQWMPGAPEIHRMFLGEHVWSPAARHFQHRYYGDDGWAPASDDCPVSLRVATLEYVVEGSGFDCSLDEGFSLRLPASDLVEGMGLRWSGNLADYMDVRGDVVAFDPTAREAGPDAFLVRHEVLKSFLKQRDLAICWRFAGEKRHLGAGLTPKEYAALRLSGAYVLTDDGPAGFCKCMLETNTEEGVRAASEALTTLRTP